MTDHVSSPATGDVWPMPPICGILGAAFAWYLPNTRTASAAIGQAVHVLLDRMRVSEDATTRAERVISELVDSAGQHDAPPAVVELALHDARVTLAIHDAGPFDCAADYAERVGSAQVAALAGADHSGFVALPEGEGTALVVAIDEHESAQPAAEYEMGVVAAAA